MLLLRNICIACVLGVSLCVHACACECGGSGGVCMGVHGSECGVCGSVWGGMHVWGCAWECVGCVHIFMHLESFKQIS